MSALGTIENPLVVNGKPFEAWGCTGEFPDPVTMEVWKSGVKSEYIVNQSEAIWIAWLLLSRLPEGMSRNVNDLVKFIPDTGGSVGAEGKTGGSL
jgi:hypothetical protein